MGSPGRIFSNPWLYSDFSFALPRGLYILRREAELLHCQSCQQLGPRAAYVVKLEPLPSIELSMHFSLWPTWIDFVVSPPGWLFATLGSATAMQPGC